MKNSNVIQETEENKRDEIVTNEEQEQPKPLMPKKSILHRMCILIISVESQASYESFSNLSLGGSPSQPGSPSSSRSNSIIDFRLYILNLHLI